MKRKLVLALAFLVTVGVGSFAGTNILSALQRQSYTATYSMQVGTMTRSYEVIAPVNALPNKDPIIVVLSGVAVQISDEVQRDLFVPFADADMAELVYPVGFGESWNAGGCCGKAASENIDDVAFMKALVARVDPGHRRPIYVVGYSNGGRLAYRIACDSPGLFDGTAIVKAMPMPGCVVTSPLRILQIDALDDTAVPYQPGDPGKESPPATVEVGLLRATDQCSQRSVVSKYRVMTLTTWDACTPGTGVGFAVYDTGGHNFPPPREHSPGAAQIIYSFFTKTAVAPLPQ
jgi:polyhydroxybutyrate depolymerase